jgi:hypothetical protein
MRNSPACQNMIKLQNYKQENPNRMFLSFKDTQKILKTGSDSRELIPDLFCYIDYLCNVNCVYFGERTNLIIVDDFSISEQYNNDTEKCSNLISQFVKYLYLHKKLLNDTKISKELYKWVDIIFGIKQCPEKKDERIKCCNIFGKLTYEKNINLEDKLSKYIERFMKDKTLEGKLISKINNRINIINNFGMCPRQILTESVIYEGNPLSNISMKNIERNIPSDSYFYFTKNNDKYYSVTENMKEPIKKVQVWDNLDYKKPNIYICKNFEIMMSNYYILLHI